LPNVSVGIVPWSVFTPLSPGTMFVLFDDQVVLVETLHGEQLLKERQQIERYLDQFDVLEALAQHDDEARATLGRIAADLRGLGS
jgi:hypothetical protein